MSRDYPYYAGREKYRGPKRCECCDEHATHVVTIQLSIFRGDDEVCLVCEPHAMLARTDYNAFVEAVKARDVHLSALIKAQHEETGRIWAGERRNLPKRYFEIPDGESA